MGSLTGIYDHTFQEQKSGFLYALAWSAGLYSKPTAQDVCTYTKNEVVTALTDAIKQRPQAEVTMATTVTAIKTAVTDEKLALKMPSSF